MKELDVDNGIPRVDPNPQNGQEHRVASATREGRCWADDAHVIIAKGTKVPDWEQKFQIAGASQNDGSN